MPGRGRKSGLTEETIAAIRADTRTHIKIAMEYGISDSYVAKLKAKTNVQDRRPRRAAY